jgi:hypothetical protein
MQLRLALDWIATLADSKVELTTTGILVALRPGLVRILVPYWIDVRDLDVEGNYRDWTAEFNANAFGGDGWIGVPELGTWLENHDGILMLMTSSHYSDEPNVGREEIRPILEYLKSLRVQGSP